MKRTECVAIVIVLAAVACSEVHGQATGMHASGRSASFTASQGKSGTVLPGRVAAPAENRLPQPVRQAAHLAPSGATEARVPVPSDSNSHADSLTLSGRPHDPAIVWEAPPMQAHRVIQAPGQRSSLAPHHGGHHSGHHDATHPPHLPLKRRLQPAPAVLPQARRLETWKSPYSYGYFGASGKRQWKHQYGYRDRFTQWTRR